MGNVVMGANIKKTSERINPNGDIVNPKTKKIIEPKEEEYVPPVVAEKTVVSDQVALPKEKSSTLTILEQIEEAKQNLKNLEELKKLKIAEKKKELELLQQ